VNRHDAEALLGRLLRQVAPEVELGELDPDALLQDEADLDSMDFLNIVTALSDQTGIEVPERDYPTLASVSGFVDYIVAAS
jgi:acyl carrier protein